MDSRATNHIINTFKFFNTYAYPSNRKIVIVDDSLTTIAGVGNTKLTHYLTLINVLHVPKLCTDLIQKLKYPKILIVK